MSANSLLTCLDITPSDKIVTILEHNLADANFIVSHLLKQGLELRRKICFVILHNTVGHYQNVLKRLGLDLLKKKEEGEVVIIEPLKELLESIVNDGNVACVQEQLPERIFFDIESTLHAFVDCEMQVIIDDFSHLMDLGATTRELLGFVNRCVNLTNDDRVSVVMCMHVADNSDGVIGKGLTYISDTTMVVRALKTGRSRDVTGVIDVMRNRANTVDTYHYKATDKEIKTFSPGQSLNYLYK